MPLTTYRAHESDIGRWEMAIREPAPALKPFCGAYYGYRESIAGSRIRRELPGTIAPLLIGIDAPFYIGSPDGNYEPRQFDAFIAGFYDTYATSHSRQPQAGIQVNFTLLGARRFFGVPLHELTNRAIEAEDVVGREPIERIRAARSWDDAFDILEDVIQERLARSETAPPAVAWAIEQLRRSAGATPIAMLAQTLECSHKQLIAAFRDQVGLAPRTLGRIYRFEHVIETIGGDEPGSWANIAVDCGYYDQAHLAREFRALAGITPGEYRRCFVPEGGLFIDD